ncbi:hypothetical protein NPIL_518011 [Nephila pilipes]|uniref:Uncharacterized protein n=1 Tax=Nephila pilipes TaxID=299642 RepID=A0A8X6IWE7_NEPPI|nr:hypothetical protein NPIL_518011 [Nephila pilipes]
MSLADGQRTTGEALTTQVMIAVEERPFLTRFIILPKTKENRTLLGTDFLSSAGMDVKNACCFPTLIRESEFLVKIDPYPSENYCI